jgi:hypothetical protein
MKRGLLGASLVAHFLVVAWILFPDPLEQLADKPETVLIEMLPPFRCPDFIWIERQSGCVVTREPVCRSSMARGVIHDQVERDHPARDDVDMR